MDAKDVLSIRLWQYATELTRIYAVFDRLEKYDDDNFSPSHYTPSRNKSREHLENLTGTIHGYCLAIDDMLGVEHGQTEARFYNAHKKGLHHVQPVDIPDHDTGQKTAIEIESEMEAEKVFGDYIFR